VINGKEKPGKRLDFGGAWRFGTSYQHDMAANKEPFTVR
jgi:hypothetical protein